MTHASFTACHLENCATRHIVVGTNISPFQQLWLYGTVQGSGIGGRNLMKYTFDDGSFYEFHIVVSTPST